MIGEKDRWYVTKRLYVHENKRQYLSQEKDVKHEPSDIILLIRMKFDSL